ncbi:MAG TPA: winged helix-turn-helix domain-containing protein [Solirubrobacterales bacterium]|nr:winged helix-turn-helix domain-containing protein [Solirubrobacterales bacterium]
MARALADPWRIRILSELSVRPLSPSRFVAEVGGELTDVARYFRQLADWGYIELLEERPGGQKGAAIEHVYVGVHRAHFDTAAWERVPRSKRENVSQSILDSYFARISEAIEAGTFDQEVDRHLSWDTVVLDRHAWTELGARLDNVLDRLQRLEGASITRLSDTSGETIPTIVGLTLFRSPQLPALILKAPRRPEPICDQFPSPSPNAFPPQMAAALSNRWRCRILMELTARPLSPSEFVEQVGGKLSNIARCFRELAKWGYIEVIEERRGGRRGGGIERVYRNTKRAYFDTATWESLPRLIRTEVSLSFLGSYYDRVREAVNAGTFDAETDRHLSWTPVTVDREAWTEIGQDLDEILDWLPHLEAESVDRVSGDFEGLIPTIVGLLSFRSGKPFISPNRPPAN